MGNETLANIAIEGVISASWAPLEKGCCQIFARECYEREHGKKYEQFRRASAALTAKAFQAGGLAMTRDQAGPLQDGDLLYKVHGSGGYGHVGINTKKCGVAENSSTSIGRVREALGFRSLNEFGDFDLVVRLPALAQATPPNPARLILAVKNGDNINYDHLESAVLKDGKFQVDAAELAKVLLGADQDIRTLLKGFGWEIYQEGNHLNDPTEPRQYLFVQKNQ